jgi:hypothetical protein
MSITPSNHTCTSQATGVVYPLDWVLELGDGVKFSISSMRPDQELYAVGGVYPTYKGYITVMGTYKDGHKFKDMALWKYSPPSPLFNSVWFRS